MSWTYREPGGFSPEELYCVLSQSDRMSRLYAALDRIVVKHEGHAIGEMGERCCVHTAALDALEIDCDMYGARDISPGIGIVSILDDMLMDIAVGDARSARKRLAKIFALRNGILGDGHDKSDVRARMERLEQEIRDIAAGNYGCVP